MRTNYHTHCDMCDGKAPASAMAEAAHKTGYEVLGFSSHAPLPFPTGWNLPEDRLGDYVSEVRRLGRQWRGSGLEILLGLEIDWIKGRRSPRDPLFDGLGLDYRLASVHFVQLDETEPFTVDEPEEDFKIHLAERAGGDAKRIWKAYYENLGALIEDGGFDILAHFDLVRKNNSGDRWFDEEAPDYLSTAFEVASLLKGRDIVVEVNLGGMARGKIESPYPSLPIMKELRRNGVRITFSADAHAPSHLGLHIGAARRLALAAGYRNVAVLTEGKWKEVPVEET